VVAASVLMSVLVALSALPVDAPVGAPPERERKKSLDASKFRKRQGS
jgi:hypothetical protein